MSGAPPRQLPRQPPLTITIIIIIVISITIISITITIIIIISITITITIIIIIFITISIMLLGSRLLRATARLVRACLHVSWSFSLLFMFEYKTKLVVIF